MDKVINTVSYGLGIFSVDTMTEFLAKKKIRSKKVLALLQKKKDLYLESIEQGIWMPIPSINSGKYVIKVDGHDDSFGDDWTQVLSYDGFNLEVRNGLWISAIGCLQEFDKTEYEGEGREGKKPRHTVLPIIIPVKKSGLKTLRETYLMQSIGMMCLKENIYLR